VTDEAFDQQHREARLSLSNIRCEVAALRVYLALKQLVALARKAGFNPAQLRLPAGQPGGGRWTDGDGGDVILVGARGRGSVAVRMAAGRSMRRRRRPPAPPWRMRERMRPERVSARPTPRGALGPA